MVHKLTYYYKNRDDRIKYQREYRLRKINFIPRKKKYKKKPKIKFRKIFKKIILSFE